MGIFNKIKKMFQSEENIETKEMKSEDKKVVEDSKNNVVKVYEK